MLLTDSVSALLSPAELSAVNDTTRVLLPRLTSTVFFIATRFEVRKIGRMNEYGLEQKRCTHTHEVDFQSSSYSLKTGKKQKPGPRGHFFGQTHENLQVMPHPCPRGGGWGVTLIGALAATNSICQRGKKTISAIRLILLYDIASRNSYRI